MNRSVVRWVPAVVAAVAIASVAIAVPVAANAAANLPTKTPQQVLELVGQSSVKDFSGTLEQSSKLGLPELPSTGAGSSSSASSALSVLVGSYTARVYVDGATKTRFQIMDKLAERDVIKNGSDVWLYDSSAKTATHATLPAHQGSKPGAATPGTEQTPGELAKRFLAAVDSSTTVSVGPDARIAGRTAYDLVLKPRASDTLISSVSIAVDSQTGLPLSIDLFARGQKDAAFSLAFSALTLQAPSANLFDFTPPKGVTVKQQAVPQQSELKKPTGSAPQHGVVGTGWDAVLAVPASTEITKLTSSSMFAQLTTATAGGRLLHTALVNVYFASDGRVFAGSVPAARLEAVAAAK
ncbi:DUF2092 domain-containing protein [Glaciihabitans sp. UYNi722]|uniref:LolA family protein n=1 Tax=Glaciihabitans sp. UYNi722 TaxID=3156344 RepID=UPI0033937A16